MRKGLLLLALVGFSLGLAGCLNEVSSLSKLEQRVAITVKSATFVAATATVPAHVRLVVTVTNKAIKPVVGLHFNVQAANVSGVVNSPIASLAVNATGNNADRTILTNTPEGGNITGHNAEVFMSGFNARGATVTIQGITFGP